MIPAVIDPTCPSPGEREIFDRLRDDPATADWIVLHSLNIRRHVTQVEGEIDFVAIVPGRGVLCIEVKAGRSIRRKDGLWYYGADAQGSPVSPFEQVGAAMHTLRENVARFEHLRDVPFLRLVIFPYVCFEEYSPEWESWELLDRREFVGRSLGAALLSKVAEAREALSRSAGGRRFDPSSSAPTAEQCAELARLLRGDFEAHETRDARAESLRLELRRFTDEQVRVIDGLDGNPRLLICGAAGSGKTFMAIEAARRADAAGRRVLFLCYNRLLGQWLAQQCADLDHVSCHTFHSQLVRLTGVQVPGDGPSQQFWDTELPAMAIDRLLADQTDEHVYDELIVDEAQDLLRDQWLDCLDLMVRGGLAAGRWRMFGDFEGQAIYAPREGLTGPELLAAATGQTPACFELRMNCRNTPRIAQLPHRLAGLDPDYDGVLRPDNGIKPMLRYYRTEQDQAAALVDSLEHLASAGIGGRDIAVLSTHGSGHSAAARLRRQPWATRLQEYAKCDQEGIPYASIQAFKGLEAPTVILTDIETVDDQQARNLVYIGVTRALERLIMLVHESAKPSISAALQRR